MIEIDKYILNRTYIASPIFRIIVQAFVMTLYIIVAAALLISGKAFENTGYSVMTILRSILLSVGGLILLAFLIKALNHTAFLKIEFKKIYYARSLPIKWKELHLQEISSATFSHFGNGGTLYIKASSVNSSNEIDIPIWNQFEGYRVADYINDLVTDNWKEKSKNHPGPAEAPPLAGSKQS
jgi:hypothetical protein